MPLSKPSRVDAPKPTGQQHLYLIFDDWELGYSIRKLKLSNAGAEQRRLPPPFIRLEAERGCPEFFAAVGTKILATHHRYGFGDNVPGGILPIIDVRSPGVRFGPELLHLQHPIFIPIGDEKLFALDMDTFKMLSMKQLQPSWLEYASCDRNIEWSWCDLPLPPLEIMNVTSTVVGSDGGTIFASTDCATFAFNIVNREWKQSSNCSLPFVGPANYVRALDIFVGLSKAPDTYGHLCFCRELGGDENVRLSKENLLSKDPAESHVGATLVYLGGSKPGFCLVECVSITEGKSGNMRLEKCVDERGGNCGELDQLKKNVDEGDGASGSMHECGELDELNEFVDEGHGASRSMHECGELDELNEFVDKGDGASGSMHYRCRYRLTTFSPSFDNNGDLTTGESAVQYYKVPEEVSEAIYLWNPVAFWL